MRIGNLELNTTTKDILDKFFRELKSSGSTLFSRGYRESNGYYMVQCPYHKMGQEKKPSAQFRASDGLFYCFYCKDPHPITKVIGDCLEVNGRAWLLENFDGSNIEERDVPIDMSSLLPKEKPKYLDKSILAQYRFTHPYMFERKLNLETIRKFDVGYDKDFTMVTERNGKIYKQHIGECITFPVKDEFGNILFIARRAIKQKFFNYPQDVDKPIYGLYELNREIKHGINIDTVYICESMFNCLTIWTWGKYAVALNGTGSAKQIETLRKLPFRHYILALDPDAAGEKGTKKIIEGLKNTKIVDILQLPTGKDVNDLEQNEFNNLQLKSWLMM